MPIQIPTYNPPQPQLVTAPEGLVERYLNQPAALGNSISNLGSVVNQLGSQVLNRKLQQQQMKIGAFKAGGPALMNALYGSNQPMTGQPGTAQQAQSSGQVMGTPSATPMGENYPDQSNQPQPNDQSQSQVPDTIQAHMALTGHPNYSGLLDQAQNYQQMGDYGREQIQNLGNISTLMQAPLNAQAKQTEMQKNQNDIAMQPTDLAIKKQQLANAAQAIPMEKNKAVTGEISKLSQQRTEVKTLQGMFDNLDKNLHSYFQNPKSFIGSANIYQKSKGHLAKDAASGAEALNQGKPLIAAINTALTHRFQMQESQLFTDALAPSPNDTPDYAARKMRMVHQILQAMDTGNKDNVSSVLQAINGQIAGEQQ